MNTVKATAAAATAIITAKAAAAAAIAAITDRRSADAASREPFPGGVFMTKKRPSRKKEDRFFL